MLNQNSTIPLYEQVKEAIKLKIEQKEWKENTRVPSETELMKAGNRYFCFQTQNQKNHFPSCKFYPELCRCRPGARNAGPQKRSG